MCVLGAAILIARNISKYIKISLLTTVSSTYNLRSTFLNRKEQAATMSNVWGSTMDRTKDRTTGSTMVSTIISPKGTGAPKVSSRSKG